MLNVPLGMRTVDDKFANPNIMVADELSPGFVTNSRSNRSQIRWRVMRDSQARAWGITDVTDAPMLVEAAGPQ